MKIQFTKAQGTGNDFVILDNRDGQLLEAISQRPVASGQKPEARSFISCLAEKLCDRKRGIGADGVLLIEESDISDIKMRIINPDGSEVSMCGNGSRCAGLYAYKKGWVKESFTMQTGAGILEVVVKDSEVKIKMTDPTDLQKHKDIDMGGNIIQGYFVNTGVEHFVCFVDDLENADVKGWGSEIRYHKSFAPKGTNANFVSVTGEQEIAVRTYERGVEGETLACGTGSVASAIISGVIKGLSSPVKVLTRSGEKLTVYFESGKDLITNVYMQGPAVLVYTGEIEI